jgi:beta-mannosidase
LKEESRPVTVEPGRSAVLMEAPLEELRNKRSADDVYFTCELAKSDKIYSSNIYHFSRLKRVAFPDPQFTTNVTVDCCAPVVEVRAENFAKDVYLEAPGCPGRFEDNFFDMLPGRTYKVRFLPEEGARVELLKSRLKLRSLKDSY